MKVWPIHEPNIEIFLKGNWEMQTISTFVILVDNVPGRTTTNQKTSLILVITKLNVASCWSQRALADTS